MKKIQVSVLIANFNGAKFITKCLNSLNNQSYKNFETIIFDDYSTDNSVKVIKSFNKIKIKLIENKKKFKEGSYNQINAYKKTLKKSKGDIIFFLDSDDWFYPRKIETVLKEFKKKKKVNFIFDRPKVKLGNKFNKLKKNKIIDTNWKEFQPQSCISGRRKNIINALKKITIKSFPDVWLDFRISVYAKYIDKNFFLLNKCLTVYRQTQKNISSKFKKYSKKWWKRRLESHNFLQYMILKTNKNMTKNADYYFTKIINSFI